MLWTIRNRSLGFLLATAFLLLLPLQTATAGNVNGVVQLGTVIMDEDAGDVTAIQETYNVYEGFNVANVRLNGSMGRRSTFLVDLREINRDSGKGLFVYRVQDHAKLSVKYGQHRQLYDADGSVASLRRDWRVGLNVTPNRTTRLTANFGHQKRTGDRLGYPAGTMSVLGGNYDYALVDGRVEAEVRKDGRKLAVGWDTSSFTDDGADFAERKGNVFSVRLNGPDFWFPAKLSHYVRAAYGKQELSAADLDYTLSNFRYLGILRPERNLQFKYRFYASRVENAADGYQTDYVRNDLDAVYHHKHGRVFGGYGYVTNDDDLNLTQYNDWRAGVALNNGKRARLKVSYAASDKTDDEQRTLLKDIESSRLKVDFSTEAVDNVTFGASYVDRKREFTVLGVSAEGERYSVFGRYDRPGYGALSVDYTYSEDSYVDRVAGFDADNRAVSARLDLTPVDGLKLATGLTYLNIGGDLDIEKSIVMFEGSYDLAEDYFVSVKYNVYNYDDYLILDRYYTANVVWLNVGYKLSID